MVCKLRTFNILLLLFLQKSALSGGVSVIQEDWTVEYTEVVTTDSVQDQESYFKVIDANEHDGITYSEDFSIMGDYENLDSGEGSSAKSYSSDSAFEFTVGEQVREDREHQTRIGFDLSAIYRGSSIGVDNSSLRSLDFRASGSQAVSVTEPVLLAVTASSSLYQRDFTAASASAIEVAMKIRGMGRSIDYGANFHIETNRDESFKTARGKRNRIYRIEPGEYFFDIEIVAGVDSLFDSRSETSESELSIDLILFTQVADRAVRPIKLAINPGDTPGSIVISPRDLVVGKRYKLEAASDLAFSEPNIIDTFRKMEIVSEIDIDIEGLGPRHFFRLVETLDAF